MFFTNAVLKLPVKDMDCGNRMMNKDMYNTLAAEQYPHIRIALREVSQVNTPSLDTCNEWEQFTAVIQLTIAGTTRTHSMPVRGAHQGLQRYTFKGRHTIRLTDFGIEPPTAMLGAVKVKNEMTINMNLIVVLGNR
ncbi:MAG: YceI family protein [Saprospiraceae bacterium]